MIATSCAEQPCLMELAGASWVASGALAGLLAAFPLRCRLPAWLVGGLLAGAGGAVALGGMVITAAGASDPGTVGEVAARGEAIAAVVAMAVLVPVHVRIVLGRFGRPEVQSPPGPPSGG